VGVPEDRHVAALVLAPPDWGGAVMPVTGIGDEVGGPAGPHRVLVPITLELGPILRLLVVDVADDPTYRALEPQVIGGADGGGLVLLAYRHDGHVELYAEPHVRVDPSGYDGLGKGVRGIHHTAFRSARFEVTADGLKVDVAFSAPNGRSVDLRMHEHLAGPRDRFPVLAPVGGAFDNPVFFPFIWLPGLSFVPVRGTDVVLRVDGATRTIPRLPLPLGGRRCLMARYDPDVMACELNPSRATDLPSGPVRMALGKEREGGIEVVDVDGQVGVAGVWVGREGHTCGVLLDPPMPDVARLVRGASLQGAILLRADGITQLEGRYEVRRAGDRVHLGIDALGPWRTRQRRPLLAVLFRLPIFRRWPTTYRWRAELDLTDSAVPGSRWASRWIRTEGR
jgi:hypothetical protein